MPPIALDPISLETVGVVPWSTKLARGMIEPSCFGDGAFTAHPKWDPETGELYGWGYSDKKPYATLQWVKPDGTVSLARPRRRAVRHQRARHLADARTGSSLPFQPFHMDLDRIGEGLSVFGWDPDLGITLALIPRDDINGKIRWISADIDPNTSCTRCRRTTRATS